MPSSQNDADSLLTIDVGSINTQVTYSMLSMASIDFWHRAWLLLTPERHSMILAKVSQGVDRLHAITGWVLVDQMSN
jgi:hypothetical protein